MEKKFVYSFNEGSKDMRALLGGKGANLAEMTKSGMPVPFGFTVTTDACKQYYADGGKIDDSIIEEIKAHQDELESVMERSSEILRIPCWFPFVPEHLSPCRA